MRIIFGFLLIGLAAHVQSYDAVDRLQLLEDRFKLQESLSPIGHDFALDTRLTIGGEIFDLVDDINEIQTLADSQAGGNENQIQAKFTELTQTWSGREFVGRYTLDAGIPLFKFKAWGLKFTPELLRFQLGATAVVGINEEVISKEDVISFLPDGVPQALQDVILSLDFNNASDNQDLALFISQEIRAGNVQGVRGELNLNEYAGLVADGVEAGDVESFIDSGSYALNALLSGSIYGGLPGNKITAFAGESATGKTFFVLGIVKQFLFFV